MMIILTTRKRISNPKVVSGTPYNEKDPEERKELCNTFLTESLAPHLALVENNLVKNGDSYLNFVEQFLGEAPYSNVPMVKALVDEVGMHFNPQEIYREPPISRMHLHQINSSTVSIVSF